MLITRIVWAYFTVIGVYGNGLVKCLEGTVEELPDGFESRRCHCWD